MTGQRIAITGSSGLIGGALSSYLRRRGDTVVRLVRRPAVGPLEVTLPPPGASPGAFVDALADVDAVVNLAGAGVGDRRWTREYRDTLWRSRVETTRTLVEALGQVSGPTRLISSSATGFYGERGDDVVDESDGPGDDFLARLCVEWEAVASEAAPRHSVALARTGLVVAPDGGAFAPLARLTRLGAGGPLGPGTQWWSWITLEDEVCALVFLLDHPDVTGPVNIVAPRAGRQVDLARSLGRSLRRPAVLPAPEWALRAALGEMSTQLTTSTRVRPRVLRDAGFAWHGANQDQALDRLVAGRRGA